VHAGADRRPGAAPQPRVDRRRSRFRSKLASGIVIGVRVTAPDTADKVARLTITRGKLKITRR